MKHSFLLLIEDNPLLTGMYRAAFEKAGLDVAFAHDGETGLKLAKDKKPDVILLDLLMPGMDGMSVLRELKKDGTTSKIKVIILTVVTDDEAKKKAEELGADGYLIKSELTLAEIVKKILSFLPKTN
ncbi:MAG TPA: response regulator [Patescibacteria group bacterium]|jgi:DNA-binding response OmpR family regulator|nr:response regulator [Patescibacteria group bacterium]